MRSCIVILTMALGTLLANPLNAEGEGVSGRWRTSAYEGFVDTDFTMTIRELSDGEIKGSGTARIVEDGLQQIQPAHYKITGVRAGDAVRLEWRGERRPDEIEWAFDLTLKDSGAMSGEPIAGSGHIDVLWDRITFVRD